MVASVIGDVEVAKVNHHGSSYSSNPTFVSGLTAEAAIISVGKNSFGHPGAAVVARWKLYGTVFQTQHPGTNALVDGDIRVTTNGASGFEVRGEHSGLLVASDLDES